VAADLPSVRGDRVQLGMGLAIARSIVDAHGDRLGAVNNPQGGATFHFTLRPCAPVTSDNRRSLGGRDASRSARAHAPALDQAALTSIVVGIAARGEGTLTSSMPFAYFASTWAASTPSGSVKLRWNAPYSTSRTK
jgi:hypothetical protein